MIVLSVVFGVASLIFAAMFLSVAVTLVLEIGQALFARVRR